MDHFPSIDSFLGGRDGWNAFMLVEFYQLCSLKGHIQQACVELG